MNRLWLKLAMAIALTASLVGHAEKLPNRNAANLYEMLGLAREATHEEIFNAFRRINITLSGVDEDGIGLALRVYGILGRAVPRTPATEGAPALYEPYRRLYHRVLDEPELAQRFPTGSIQLDLMKGFARSMVSKFGDSMPPDFTDQRYDEEFNDYVVHFHRQTPRAAREENIDGTGNDRPADSSCWSSILRVLRAHFIVAVAAASLFFASGHGGIPPAPPMPWQPNTIQAPNYEPPAPPRTAPRELTPAEKAAQQFGRDLDLRIDD